MLTQTRSFYGVLMTFLVFLMVSLTPGILYAQSIKTVPPGGAALLSLPGQGGEEAKIKSFEAPKVGTAYFLDGKKQLVYKAPAVVDDPINVTIAYKLEGETAPRSFELKVDPTYSAKTDSVISTALEWLFVLLILALFIEAAVLVVVALIRAFLWFRGGKAALDVNSPKPSLYKSVFAVILSGMAVVGFGLDPLNDIVSAFGSERTYQFGSEINVFADIIITILLVAGGAESVRRVATGIMTGLGVPTADKVDEEAIRADTRS